jgi:hypothetical protein
MKHWTLVVILGIIVGFTACSNGSNSSHSHDSGMWHTTIEATCTLIGTKELRCTSCDEVLETDIITALGHDLQPTANITTPPTCEENGVGELACIRCDYTEDSRVIAALGHQVDKWSQIKVPALTEDGKEEGLCSHCGETITQSILSINAYLKAQTGGNSPNDPIPLTIQINLSNAGWQNLLELIAETDKYVNIDLSDCTGMVEFDPGTANTGEKMIVSFVLPNTATSIASSANGWGNSTFMYFTELQNISGLNIVNVGDAAFQSCRNLKNVSFPSATSISGYVFDGCRNLIKAGFPSVVSISDGAFRSCSNLTEISFSAAATEFRVAAFSGCNSLTKFNLAGTGNLGVVENGKILVRNTTELVAYPSASGNIVMDTITSVADSAFYGCSVTDVSLPLATSIGNYTFRECRSLADVSIPLVTSIGDHSFLDCRSLRKVIIGTITEANFSTAAFTGTGNLRDVYFGSGGGAGTYITPIAGNDAVWSKQQ